MIGSLYRRLREARLSPTERRNAQYDRHTVQILRSLPTSSNFVDVGAAAGSVLRAMVKHAPHARHFAFEPRPDAARELRRAFPGVAVHGIALSDRPGHAAFQLVVDDPMWSGFRRQPYAMTEPRIREITVSTARLDDVLPGDLPIALIKIDVEGAESLVLRGSTATCLRWRPLIIVEYGLAGRQSYGVSPAEFFEIVSDVGLYLSTLKSWLEKGPTLDGRSFEIQSDSDWYFIAHPAQSTEA